MEIVVLSDSHGRPDAIREVLKRQTVRPAAVFFLGDGLRDLDRAGLSGGDCLTDVYSVRGNCDLSGWLLPEADNAPEERMVDMGGVRFLLMHGHRHSVKSGVDRAAEYAVRRGADALLYGHTHTPVSYTYPAGTQLGQTVLTKPLLIFNPGSIGEGYPPSFGHLTLQGGVILASHGTLA